MTVSEMRGPQPFRGFRILPSDDVLIAKLKPEYRAVLRATGTYAELAQQFKVSDGTLRNRLHRARAALVALRHRYSRPPGGS
jgi:hypothetical protein